MVTMDSSQDLQQILAKKMESRSIFGRTLNKINNYPLMIKILLLVVISMTITITLIHSYFFFVLRPTQVTSELARIEEDLSFLADSFEKEINLSRSHVYLFSESSFLDQMVASMNTDNYTSSVALARQHFLDLSGNLERLLEVVFVNATLHKVIDVKRDLDTNQLISQVEEEIVPPLFQPIFNRVKNLPDGEVYTSNIQLDRDNLTLPVIVFATPIYNQAESFVGVVSLTFYLQPSFDQVAARVKSLVSPDAELAMLDSFGIYLFNTVEPRWTGSENRGNGENFFIKYENIPKDFLSSDQGHVLLGNKLLLSGTYLIQTRLNIEFSNSYFRVHFVLFVPAEVLLGAANRLAVSAVVFVLLAGGIGAVITAVATVYGITKPINSLTTLASKLTAGDLNISIEPTLRGDEIGQLQNQFFQMVLNLRELVGTIRESNEIVMSISENVSAQSEEVTAAAEEVAASVQNVTRGASSQAEQITRVSEQLDELERVVTRVVQEIQSNAHQINEIARLTRILSLNATIEASRAGQEVGGFMVIAENVQSLARETRSAARTINVVIREISENVKRTLEIVSDRMREVSSVSEETAALSEEVSASISEIISAMEDMTVLSQSLSDQASKAAMVVSKFKTGGS